MPAAKARRGKDAAFAAGLTEDADFAADLPDDPAVTLPADPSEVERLAGKLSAARDARIDAFSARQIGWLRNWRRLARAAQLPPPGDWRVWLVLGGRGFGKTRAGAEWVRARAETDGQVRIALVAATFAEGRTVMIEGDSGLLAIAPDDNRPKWEPTLRRLSWSNGAQAFLYSAGEPESLRGPQHHLAWCDEIGKWPAGMETWRNLEMGMRLGQAPRIVATTTPRPVPLVRWLIGEAGVVTTGGRTADNRAHLAASFLESITARHGGTLTGRQELDGELIAEIEGALWSRDLIERSRIPDAPALTRIVVGVDPPAGAGAGSDACGIVVVGQDAGETGHVLADASIAGAAPDGWARAVKAAAEAWGADRIVAEANNGGAMIEHVLRASGMRVPIQLVHAAHGKVARAEPVQALYAAGRVRHVGAFPALEDEMAGLLLGGGYEGPGRSPDRADALVWALTALLLERRPMRPSVRVLG